MRCGCLLLMVILAVVSVLRQDKKVEFSCSMVLMENKMGWNNNDVNDEKEVSLERNW